MQRRSGYLGQFIVQHFTLQPQYRVAFTHHSTSAPDFGPDVEAFWVCAAVCLALACLITWRSSECSGVQVDLATGQGLQDVFEAMGVVEVVLNCAAQSSPGQCEQHPEAARCAGCRA